MLTLGLSLGLGSHLRGSAAPLPPPSSDPASGGDLVTDYVENDISYRSHAFTTDGTFTVATQIVNADILLVGGGGSGGCNTPQAGGGGHCGEVAVIRGVTLAPGNYAVTIGQGGVAPDTVGYFLGANGNVTSFGTMFKALGGGGGGAGAQGPAAVEGVHIGGGGSGTVGSNPGRAAVTQIDVVGPPSEDYYGEDGGASDNTAAGSDKHSAGGGGGAGAPGQAGDNQGNGGDGGAGIANTFLDGTAKYYGGGGGGASRSDSTGTGSRGEGGIGGGGRGGWAGTVATAGTPNTGGGGGGGGGNAAVPARSGGSGIAVIRYPFDQGGEEANVAGDFFVAFETGNNLYSGLSPLTPKKTLSAADVAALGPNKTIRLKGGETYAATLPTLAAGTILDGNSDGDWGTGRAILGGGVRITGWQTYATFGGLQCWRADLPAGFDPAFAVWQDGTRLMLANNNTANATAYTTLEQNVTTYKAASAYSNTEITAAYISNYVTQVPGDHLYMQCFATSNWVVHTPLRNGSGTASTHGIDYVNGKIRFALAADTGLDVADGRHLILNHPDDFDGTRSAAKVGTMFVDAGNVWGNGPSIYLIPFNAANPNTADIRWTMNQRALSSITANNVELRSLDIRYCASYATNATLGKITPEANGVRAFAVDDVSGFKASDLRMTSSGIAAVDGCTDVELDDVEMHGIIGHRPWHLTGCSRVRVTRYTQTYCHSGFTFYNCNRVIFAPTYIGPIYGRHGNTVTVYESGSGASLKPPSDVLVLGGTWAKAYTNNGLTSRFVSNLVMFGSVLGHTQFTHTDWIVSGLPWPNSEGGYLYSNVTGPAGGQINLRNIGANGNAALSNMLIRQLDPDWSYAGARDCDRKFNHWRPPEWGGDIPTQASYTTGTGLTRGGEVYQANDISNWFQSVSVNAPDGRLTANAPSTLATGRRYRIPKLTYDPVAAPNDVILVNWIGAFPKNAVTQPDGSVLAANTMPDYAQVANYDTASGTLLALTAAAAGGFFEATVRCTGWHGVISWVVTNSATPPASAVNLYQRTNLNGTLVSAGKRPIFGFSDAVAGDEPWAWRIYGAAAGQYLHATHVLFEQQTAGDLNPLANGNIVTVQL